MKTLLASLVFAFSTIAAAQSYELPQKSTGLSLLTEGTVTVETPKPKCPHGAMCEIVSVLKIQFSLGGCMDQLGPVTINYVGQTAEGKMKYLVTAYNVANEASTYTKCFRAPVGVASLVLGMGFLTKDSIEVEFATSLVHTKTF